MAVLLPGLSLWRKALAVLQFVLVLICWLLLSLYLVFKLCERQSMIDALPAPIEPGRVLLIGGESGLREGCGVAIFTLSTATQQQLRSGGLAFLAHATQARGDASAYYRYGPWRSTPEAAEDGISDVWVGLGCADPVSELAQRISRGLSSPGSFYALKDEGMLVLLPAEGLIVFAYNG